MIFIAITIGAVTWLVVMTSGMALEEHSTAQRDTKELRFKAMFLSGLGIVLCVVTAALFYMAGAA